MQAHEQSFAELMNSMYKSGAPNQELAHSQLNKESIKFNELQNMKEQQLSSGAFQPKEILVRTLELKSLVSAETELNFQTTNFATR
jgi:hypothetical protein